MSSSFSAYQKIDCLAFFFSFLPFSLFFIRLRLHHHVGRAFQRKRGNRSYVKHNLLRQPFDGHCYQPATVLEARVHCRRGARRHPERRKIRDQVGNGRRQGVASGGTLCVPCARHPGVQARGVHLRLCRWRSDLPFPIWIHRDVDRRGLHPADAASYWEEA